MDNTIFLSHGFHKGNPVIKIQFDYNREIISGIKQVTGVFWNRAERCWMIASSYESLTILRACLSRFGKLEENEKGRPLSPDEEITEQRIAGYLNTYTDYLKSRRFAESTIKVYEGVMRVFLNFFPDKKPEKIEDKEIIRFNNDYLLKKNLSSAYQNQSASSIKQFFAVVGNRKVNIEKIHRPRREKKDPRILNKEEIGEMLKLTTNLKHKAMLSLIYACGLRCGELLRLVPTDIDSKRKVLYIRQTKGNKDRMVPLGPNIISLLREYYKVKRPVKWLFEGEKPGSMYSERSLEYVLKQAVKRAKIDKPVTLHWLRHSYATHLHEDGYDIRTIQVLLGHKSTRTTEIYTHVSTRNIQNVRSPFEDL